MLPFKSDLGDSEGIRHFLDEFNESIDDAGLGKLIRCKDIIIVFMGRYENPNVVDSIAKEISSKSPEYQKVKPLLEQTLSNIYKQMDKLVPPGGY